MKETDNVPLRVAHCNGVCPSWFLECSAWEFQRYRSSAVVLCPRVHAQLSGVQPRESCRRASTSPSSTIDGFSSRHRNSATISLKLKMNNLTATPSTLDSTLTLKLIFSSLQITRKTLQQSKSPPKTYNRNTGLGTYELLKSIRLPFIQVTILFSFLCFKACTPWQISKKAMDSSKLCCETHLPIVPLRLPVFWHSLKESVVPSNLPT